MAKLECKNLSLTLCGRIILKNINFFIDKGVNVLAGENGSGKSVLFNCITSSIKKYEGNILIDDTDQKKSKKTLVGYIPPDARSAIIGSTGLEDVLFSLSKMPKDMQKKRAEDIFSSLSCEELLEKSTDSMSTGELRRVNIASQIALDREIILMDEPFTGLDYKGSVMLIELIKKLKSLEKNIFIISHELDRFLKYANKLIILKNGEIREIGEPENILDKLLENNIHRPNGKIEDMSWA